MQKRKNAAKVSKAEKRDRVVSSGCPSNEPSVSSPDESQSTANPIAFGAPIAVAAASNSLHTPNPHPGRGVYGFALYLFAWILFIAYLLWAVCPHWLLISLGLTYLPAKYWAIAIPLLLPICVGVYVLTIFAINLIRFQGVFDRINYLQHDFIEPSQQ